MAGDPPCWSHLFDDYGNESESGEMTKEGRGKREGGRGRKGAGRGKREGGSGKNRAANSVARAINSQAAIPPDIRQFLSANQTRIEQELFDFLRIRSDYGNESESGEMTKEGRGKREGGRGRKGAGRGKREGGSGKNRAANSVARAINSQAAIPPDIRQFLSANQTRIEQELFDFLRI